MTTRVEKGRCAESLAAEYLKRHGLLIVDQNYRCPIGEIDLVGKDGKTVVFVEVRSRSSANFGLPQESVTPTKQRRLTRLAQWYLKHQGLEHSSARFDVVAVMWQDGEPQLTWIVNAFEAHT